MSFFYDNATFTSATPFNDTLQGSGGPPPLVLNMTQLPRGIRYSHSSGVGVPFVVYLFFVFPVMGFAVLIVGSYVLHRRRATQDAEAILQRRERVDAAREKERTREERRMRLVERALITTKATTAAKRKSTSPMPMRARGRSSTIETDFTAESLGDDADGSDSTTSSSCSYLTGARRASEESSHAKISVEEERANENRSERAERGEGPATPSNVNVIYNTTEGSPGAHASLERFDWRTETCAICLEPYEEDDDVSYSRHVKCRHAFHAQCIYSWLVQDESRDDCPCCRGPYLRLRGGDGDESPAEDVARAIDSTAGAEAVDP